MLREIAREFATIGYTAQDHEQSALNGSVVLAVPRTVRQQRRAHTLVYDALVVLGVARVPPPGGREVTQAEAGMQVALNMAVRLH